MVPLPGFHLRAMAASWVAASESPGCDFWLQGPGSCVHQPQLPLHPGPADLQRWTVGQPCKARGGLLDASKLPPFLLFWAKVLIKALVPLPFLFLYFCSCFHSGGSQVYRPELHWEPGGSGLSLHFFDSVSSSVKWGYWFLASLQSCLELKEWMRWPFANCEGLEGNICGIMVGRPAVLHCCHWDAQSEALDSLGCLLVVYLWKSLCWMHCDGRLLSSLNLPCLCNPQEGSESTDDSSIVNKSFIDG